MLEPRTWLSPASTTTAAHHANSTTAKESAAKEKTQTMTPSHQQAGGRDISARDIRTT